MSSDSELDETDCRAEEHDPEASGHKNGPKHSQYGSVWCRLGDDERRRASRKHHVNLTSTGADSGFVLDLTEDRHRLTGVELTFDVPSVVSDVQFDDLQVPCPLLGVDVVVPFDKLLNPVRRPFTTIDIYRRALIETESHPSWLDEYTA